MTLNSPRQLERAVAIQTAELAEANVALRREVEDRVRIETELRDQQEWFRVVLASIGDAIVATDSHGRVAFLNPVAEQYTGWQHESAVGQPVEEVVKTVDEDTRQWVESPVAKVLRDARAVGLANHTLLSSRSGVERIVDRSASPIRTPTGEVLGVVMAIRDATARRTAEAELARSRWLAGIGETTIALEHEINNPLSALLGHAELLLMDRSLAAEHQEQLHIIQEQAARIAQVVRRLAKLKNPQSVEYLAGARMLDLSSRTGRPE